jgi:hypothetical protein
MSIRTEYKGITMTIGLSFKEEETRAGAFKEYNQEKADKWRETAVNQITQFS